MQKRKYRNVWLFVIRGSHLTEDTCRRKNRRGNGLQFLKGVTWGSWAIIALLLSTFEKAEAVPPLKLPFLPGETWYVTQGNGGDFSHHVGSPLEYAWDFNALNDKDRPTIAAAGGTVIYAQFDSDWGNTVIIDYGDGSYGQTSHMNNSCYA